MYIEYYILKNVNTMFIIVLMMSIKLYREKIRFEIKVL